MKLTVTKPLTLRLPRHDTVMLTLVGCGGTGSHIASGLASIALALAEKNVRADIRFIDGDRVEPKNVGRQLFSPADVGRFKAEALADRLNRSYGLTIGAACRFFDKTESLQPRPGELAVVIGAVDNNAARALIHDEVKRAGGRLWWLDCGNENHSGQVLLGNITDRKRLRPALGFVDSLPAPSLQYPDCIKTPKRRKAERGQSCAELTALGEQGLMVNRMAAAWALALLNDLLLGQVRYVGLAFDAGQGGARAWPLDEATLKQL